LDISSLVILLLEFALVGFIVYLIVTYIPMPEPFKQVIVVACVILLILYVLTLLSGHSFSPTVLRK